MNILEKIIAVKRHEVERAKLETPLTRSQIGLLPAPSFKNAIRGKGTISLVAEIKKASPSKGVIRKDFDPLNIAGLYERCGAAAISVLTDKTFFMGDLVYIGEIRKRVGVPLLRKDFIIDEYQLLEASAAGASAVLLIAAVLDLKTLQTFIASAKGLGMDALVEVHTLQELTVALDAGGEIIGINNRDLGTFTVSLQTTFDLVRNIPKETVIVSESGISSRKDIADLRSAGVDAVLIGEALMREQDIETKIRELFP
jgi:indole-3-glycerol phosphate synthase